MKNKYKIVLICGLAVAFSVQLTNWIEKQYTSTFEINVYSKYFQNPLISEVIPDVYNIPEMRFAIDSMVKEAMNDDFIDGIGRDFNIYSGTDDERELSKERQLLRDRFSAFSTGGQSYQISFSYKDPYIAKAIVEKTLVTVKSHIIDKRIKTIEMIKEVMVKRLNSFSATQKLNQQGGEKVLASKSPEALREELQKIENNLAALSKQYSENHPVILNLIQRKETVTSWLQEFTVKNDGENLEITFGMTPDRLINEQLSSKFYTKYHDFNIALDIEKKSLESYIGLIKMPQLPTAPIWPKKRLFASLGLIMGLVISFIVVFMGEVLLPSRDEKLRAEAKLLESMFLGSMPKISAKTLKQQNKKVVEQRESVGV
jgi:hypothetical protein